MNLPFDLPPLHDGIIPLWLGNEFKVGENLVKVLSYSSNTLGWNDELTSFHEESAGDQHFIDRASRDHAIYQLNKNLHEKNPTILEVGCSSGYMLERIQKAMPNATLMGADVVHEPLLKLTERLPNVPLLRFDMVNCPLPDQSVDAIVMLNVLEHIKEDAAALKQVFRILKPGGVAIIEVPAGPHLYDPYDKILMHYRRYILSDLCQLAKNQGFQIKHKSHLGFFLYPGFWMVKKRNIRLINAAEDVQRRLVENNIRDTGKNRLFHAIMQTELKLGRFISYPFGIRCLLTCKKPHKSVEE